MPRTVVAGAMTAGLLVLMTGTGCRLFHRHDQCGTSAAKAAPPACPPGGFVSNGRSGVPPIAVLPGEPVTTTSELSGLPTSFGGPVYPVGEPVPLRSSSPSPANELPYPTIPNPNVPEGPSAQPFPATPANTLVPPAPARTTADPKAK